MDWFKKNKVLYGITGILMIILIVSVVVISCGNSEFEFKPKPKPTKAPVVSATEEPTEAPLTYTEITFLSAGDIMYHRPQLRAAYKNGIYDFTENMKYVKPIIEAADYATANFETTLSRPNVDFLAAPQYPSFNAPDTTLDSIKNAGFDLMFFSNNHCYDYSHDGLMRTMQVFKDKGMEFVGTRPDTESKSYKIVDVKGVKIGIINYMQLIGAGINGRIVKEEDKPLIDTFDANNPGPMYQAIESRMKEMKEQGADLILVYMHWGNEYTLDPTSSQKAIAQKLCDMGVDITLASHPHVIQPMEVITSSDGSRVMPCFYSMGNYISNQNRNNLAKDAGSRAPYTENGIMPILTIRKYSNGTTVIRQIEYVATWVHIGSNYWIIPIEKALNAPGEYGLSSTGTISAAKKMTDDLVKAGVDKYNSLWADPFPEATLAE